MVQTVMGLDLSTKSTGIAFFQGRKLIHSETIAAGSSDVIRRIKKIVDRIEQLVIQYKPTRVISEDPQPAFVHNNRDVYRKLTWLQGAVALMLENHNLSYDSLCESSHWRKLVGIKTGRGVGRSSLKALDIARCKELFSKQCNDDEADAILIGYSYVLQNCVEKIEWGEE